MKLKYIFPILFIALLNVSCSSDNDDDDSGITNEVTGLTKIQDLTNATHTIELFNTTGQFKTGYNAISLRVIDNATNSYLEDANLSWIPMMQMPTMEHSSPKSTITKTLGKDTVYDGFIIYQMTNLDGSGWSLTVNYTINGIDYTVTDAITVLQNDNQNSASFMGSDDSKYIVALVEPNDPKIAINNLKVGLFKMENMMTFPVVEDFTITLDPRMPGMGNHTSPNNTDLTYNSAEQMYNANLALTMTGYWVLNLKLLNTNGEVLKGEDVTEDNTQSSLYLELEF
ncbi:hypothetical protein [Psychroserpens sp. NJDZ02]|uniref:hypothetical protein n=1 Tax=Psychroserpens sp. NJDZ02 TaxID=2570561 RepID=UPI0010A79C2E|nr:hypothetical protein [Psychroserpens sp. NJDZ02]QCE40787.1 hypothetical protein E9099_04925 [Psychroserpens sp. NJDZ02]